MSASQQAVDNLKREFEREQRELNQKVTELNRLKKEEEQEELRIKNLETAVAKTKSGMEDNKRKLDSMVAELERATQKK